MEDVFDASWQAGSDGRDPNIETALASLIDVRGVALVAHPAQLRLMLVQACPDAPRHIDALLAAVEAGVAERLRAADDDATLPALLRQCANVLQQKTSLDPRWSAWAVRAWAHAFALPTDARAAKPAPVVQSPVSVPFGRSNDVTDRVVRTPTTTTTAAGTAPVAQPVPVPVPATAAMSVPTMPTPAVATPTPMPAPTTTTPLQADPLPASDAAATAAPGNDASTPTVFDEVPAAATSRIAPAPPASLFDEPALLFDEPAPPLDEPAPFFDKSARPLDEPAPPLDEPSSSRASDATPAPAPAVDDRPTPEPARDEAVVAAAPAIVMPSTAPSIPTSGSGPLVPPIAPTPESRVPPARRGASRPVIAIVAVIVVAVAAWLGLDAMGRRAPASTTTSQQIVTTPPAMTTPVALPPPSTIAQAPVAPPAALEPPRASAPPAAEAPMPATEPAKREPSTRATTPDTTRPPIFEPTPSPRPKRSRPSPEAAPQVAARAPAPVSTTKADATRVAAQKAHAKELAASRKSQANPRSEGKAPTGTCSEASCSGVVVAAHVLDVSGAVRGSIYTVVVRADGGRTLSFTTADRPPVGTRVRIVGGRLVRTGG